uniref:Magnesium transporter n=1 Tax=Kalanchoe fedtschenkoi TaxID=63787 RepID=A0A7N0RCV5_KALFE
MAQPSPNAMAQPHPQPRPAPEDIGKAAVIVQTRRKATAGTRSWLVVTESGQRLEEVGKQTIMARTGLPARDLRVLDPMLSYPSTILGRERAIVVNLEHVKAIVTAKEVLMAKSTNPLVIEFVLDLQLRVASGAPRPEGLDGTGAEDVKYGAKGFPPLVGKSNGDGEGFYAGSNNNEPVSSGPKVLPFEFRALEACIESACKCLESETHTLEQEAYPALDELSSKVSNLNLDRVRQIKNRLVAISGRVQKVRDEFEHLLDDDNDMAEMYLTEKLLRRSFDQMSSGEDAENTSIKDENERIEDSDCASTVFDGFKPDIQELEMLLEAYLAQIAGILQRLSDMNDYVGDTEDFINIMLDEKQNQLLQMGVMLSIANMILNAGIVVFGLFGMNISIPLFDGKPIQFWETAFGTVGGCIAAYVLSIRWWANKYK